MKHRLTPASVAALGSLVITLLAGGVLMSTGVKADEHIDDVTISVESSCTLASGGGTYNETVVNNSTTEVTGNTIKALCNDAGGYALYAIGYSGDSYTGNNNKMIASIGNDYNINTGTSGSSSYWAMKLTAVSGTYAPIIAGSSADTQAQSGDTDYSGYAAVPSTFTRVAYRASGTDVETEDDPTPEGSSLTPGYKVYISGVQPAGTYTGKVKYMLLHPNTMTAGTYTVTYNANGGSGSMESSTGLYNFEDQTLPASTFTAPSGYGFAGWCTVQEVGANPQTTCAGTSYADEGTVPASTVANNGTLSLYAVWKLPPTMQSMSLAQCTTTPMDAVDVRDGQTYKVAKLADGNCWMLDNLAIDLVSTSLNDLKGTSEKSRTNASDATLGYLKGGGGTSPKTGTAVAYSGTSDTYNTPLIAVSGTCYDANCVNDPTSGNWQSTSTVTTGTVQNRKVGVYYNYCAASAGSYCYTYSSSSGDATEDICPAGWHMPSGGTTNGSYYYLYNTGYSADYTNFVTALSTPLSGSFYSGTARDQGSDGGFWSSSRYDNDNMYRLYVSTSSVNPQSSRSRSYGRSVRCVRTAS